MGKKIFILSIMLSTILIGCSVDINPGAGGFTISDTKIKFGSAYVGDIKQVELTLKNGTNASISVNLIQLSGSNWDNFFITSGGDYPISVEPGKKHSILLSFSPDSIGSKEAVLRIEYGIDQFFLVELSGSGKLVNGLMLLPSSYNFGKVNVGELSSVNFTLSNGTSDNVTVALIDLLGTSASEFSVISGGNVPILVPGNSVHVITVQFSPTSGGYRSTQLHVELNDGVTSFNSIINAEAVVSIGLTVTPSNYDFGEVGINSKAEAIFTIKNTGNGDVILTGISIANDLYNSYKIETGAISGSVTLTPGEEYQFSISFSPLSVGKKVAKFNIGFLATGSPLVGQLSGIGSDQPTLSPISCDFGSIGIGDDSTEYIFTFSNPTANDINVTNIVITGPDASAFSSNPTGASTWPVLANGGTLIIKVTFTPTKEGSHTATLNVTSGVVYQATLTGNGISIPSFEISPTSYDFGSVITGSSDSKAFKVTNNGTGQLDLLKVEFLNNAEGNFTVLSGGSGSSVNPGENHLIIVEFSPVTNGLKSSTMRIIHNAAGSPELVSLEGEGSDVALTPGNIDFGEVEITTTSSAQTLTVRNTTPDDILLTNINITGLYASQFNSNPYGSIGQTVLANGGTYQFTVTCSPLVLGEISAVLNVVYSGGSLSTNLFAKGVEKPVFSITPSSYNFGRVRLGMNKYQNFTVRNTGTGILTLKTIDLINNSTGDFAIVSGDEDNVDITSGFHTIRIIYKPQSFGNHSCTLQITHNGTGSPISPVNVTLLGEGYGPEFNLIPDVSTYSFGDCYVDKELTKLFYISNGGDEVLTISSVQLSNSNDFAIRDLAVPLNLAPGGIKGFTLVFKPTNTGSRQTTLTINHNSVNQPKTVTITGTGLDAPGGLNENFESNPSSWSYIRQWEWGVPRNTVVPTSAHSGSRCFGTNIDGNYDNNLNCYLASPTIDLSKASKPVLRFYMYVYCYTGDGGWVELSTDDGNSWTRNLNPTPAYNNTVNGGGGFNQNSGGWVEVTIDLAQAAGKSKVKLAWYFYSNQRYQEAGWYIDDVVVEDSAQPYPYNPVPYDNDINVIPDNNKLTLKWDCDDANTYDVYLSQNNPPTTKVASGISGKSYQATVQPGKKYFWRVVANHSNSKRTGQVWYFETVSSVPKVLINECDTRSSVDWVEFYNTENHPVYIGGWELTIYADNNSNPDGTFVFPKGTILGPRELVVVHDNQAASNTVYRADFNIEWANATSPGEVIFTYPSDYGKRGVDYMKFNTLYNHKPADLSWSGTLSSNNTSLSSWYRNKLNDTDSSSDWSVRYATPSNKGVANPGQ